MLAFVLGLQDHQLDSLMTAARHLSPERRWGMFERVEALLRQRRDSVPASDADIADAIEAALLGLVQEPAA
jgi:hypothetical protein